MKMKPTGLRTNESEHLPIVACGECGILATQGVANQLICKHCSDHGTQQALVHRLMKLEAAETSPTRIDALEAAVSIIKNSIDALHSRVSERKPLETSNEDLAVFLDQMYKSTTIEISPVARNVLKMSAERLRGNMREDGRF